MRAILLKKTQTNVLKKETINRHLHPHPSLHPELLSTKKKTSRAFGILQVGDVLERTSAPEGVRVTKAVVPS